MAGFNPNSIPGAGMFDASSFFVGLIFLVVVGGIGFVIVRGIQEWSHNNAQPKIPASAKVVTKRTQVTQHHHSNNGTDGMHHTSSSTSYYVTFEYTSGDRVELHVSAKEYGMLAEGDGGTLTTQGTRYISFERES